MVYPQDAKIESESPTDVHACGLLEVAGLSSLRPCRVGCRETGLTTCWLDMTTVGRAWTEAEVREKG